MFIKRFAATKINLRILGFRGGKSVGFAEGPVMLGSGGVGGVISYLQWGRG